MKKLPKKHYLDIKSWLLVLGLLCAALVISIFAIRLTHNFTNTPVVFVLAVLLVARFTDGYVYGITTAVIGTFLVNYAFTFPLLKIDLSLYPMCLVLLLTIAVTVSMLMSQYKIQARLQHGLEREKMTSDLLRSVSHDLRTPLTTIAGSASVYLEEGSRLSEETKTELITDVRDESQRLIRIVENILTITRVDDNRFSINKSPEPVEEIVGAAILGFKKNFGNIKVRTEIPDELLLVPMDVMLIYQVLKNLMENSAKHGGGVTEICISVHTEGNFAVFRVSDDGCGISSELLSHLLDGIRVSPGGNSNSAGNRNSLGIGLSLCRSIIRLHGGTLSGNNNNSGGAEFTFTLPLQ